MNIREYRPEDCEMIANLFYETIHSVNSKDYTEILYMSNEKGTTLLTKKGPPCSGTRS